jgi:hypothetical protein
MSRSKPIPRKKRKARTSNRAKRVRRRVRQGKRQSARARSLQVVGDLSRNPSLAFTQAARDRGVDPATVWKYRASVLYRDKTGRVRVRQTDRYRQTLYIQSPMPGVSIPVPTKNRRERKLVGRWQAAMNAAGRNDFSLISKFPRGQFVGGVRLPTGSSEVQAILEAHAERESPYEGLYRTIARPS